MKEIDLTTYEPLVQKIARRYHKTSNHKHELDDILQAGRMGLVLARNKFDKERGNKFITYATTYVEFTIIRWLRDHGTTIKIPNYIDITDVDMELPTTVDSSELVETEANTRSPFANTDLELTVKSLLNLLDGRTHIVVSMYYLEHKTLDTIAEELEISSQRVHQILNSGLKKLREHMAQNDMEAGDLLN